MKRIGVGIVGASPLSPGWAVAAHIPALKALPEYNLLAVSTSRRDSADAAARAFGISATFDNHLELLMHPGVDLVVVEVKVPNPNEIVAAALKAGKYGWNAGRQGPARDLLSLPRARERS